MSMLVDGIDDLRPCRDWKRVTHAFDHQEFGAGNRVRGILAAFRADQGIYGAVNDECWRFDRAQPLLAAAGCQHRAELPSDAGRVEPALECALGTRAVERLILRKAADAQDLPGLREACEIFFLCRRR